ncbi:DUF4013 family protein [Natronomonas moolapensis 8.8.11]|uniref:DUF4013 family protein n=1 Tax=Natronomonas moolapensis (strain DSM 18674 / CECT 7526 / JCM 14361 / 8.8.11) TaxID=268739 RepID=M1Y0K3_NATM8|nr:DUF4013 domain-containing protein [Natronomonas moolapensis]CCQ35981.1 DUF4013 family protein [Natronomonas moolapensis 8.8.11]
MLREALDYPTRSPEGGRSVIVGGLVLVVITACLGVAALGAPYAYAAALGLLPWLLVRGYYVRVVRTSIGRERPTPPRFGDVRRLFRDGAVAVGISAVYLLPGSVVLAPLVGVRAAGTDVSAVLLERAVPGAAATAATSLTGVAAVVALMYAIGALYVLPVAVARFAHSNRVRAAFEIGPVVSGAISEDYATAWGISIALRLFVLPFTYLLRLLLVGFFLQFHVSTGARYCYGQGAGAALGLDAVPATHERSDPEEWAARPAVSRVPARDGGIGSRRQRPGRGDLTPAVRRVTEGVTDAGAETDGGSGAGRSPGASNVTDGGSGPGGDGASEGDGDAGGDADASESRGFDGGFRPAIGPVERGGDTDGRDGHTPE